MSAFYELDDDHPLAMIACRQTGRGPKPIANLFRTVPGIGTDLFGVPKLRHIRDRRSSQWRISRSHLAEMRFSTTCASFDQQKTSLHHLPSDDVCVRCFGDTFASDRECEEMRAAGGSETQRPLPPLR